MDSWDIIQDLYENRLGIPKSITYLLSIELIVKGCAMGLSNSRISKRLDIDVFYISQILSKEVDFEGWTNDLDFSPLAIYNRSDGNFIAYKQEIETISPFYFEDKVKSSFYVCKVYNNIKKEIDKYYG